MSVIYSSTFFFITLAGIFLGIYSFIRSRAIFSGFEKSTRKIILDSSLFGISLSLLLFGGVFFIASITNKSYQWNVSSLLKSFAFFLIPGVVVFVGSLWQYYIVGVIRERVLRKMDNMRHDKTNHQ